MWWAVLALSVFIILLFVTQWSNFLPPCLIFCSDTRKLEDVVTEADEEFKGKNYTKALSLYLEAAKIYKGDFERKTNDALAGRRHAFDWTQSTVPFKGAHTFNQLGKMYTRGLGVEADKEARNVTVLN